MLFVSINHANPWGMEIKVNCENGQGNKRGGEGEMKTEGKGGGKKARIGGGAKRGSKEI